MKPSFFTVTVAPLTVLPLKKALFSYSSPKDLAPGTHVTIPFSGREITGIVLDATLSTYNEKPEWLKEITAIGARSPLTREQLLLAEAVSHITFTPLGKVLKHFTPKVAKERKPVQKSPNTVTLQTFSKSKEVAAVLTKLKDANRVFFPFTSSKGDTETLGYLAEQLQEISGGQVLILTPDIAAAVQLEKAWEAYFEKTHLASLYSTKTAGQYFAAWNAVQDGSARIIIATRSGCFAPFQKLSAIIQVDPNDEAYKQWDMSPRYHTDAVLPVLQNIWGAQLVQVGPTPPLAVLADNTPQLSPHTSSVQPEWINLKTERFQKNWSAFSAPLQTAIREALTKKQQVLLTTHQGGLESFSVCAECRTIFRCPSCHSALKLTASDQYHCKHCGFRSSLFPQCPSCKNIHFKSVGYGTEKIAREAAKIFPGATIAILDKKHLSDHRKIAALLAKPEPDIVIATASYLRFPPLSRLSLVAIIDADTLLSLPGFRKDEQFIELIERAKGLASPEGRLLVQTFHPESDIFQKITLADHHQILTQILEERQILRYPPFYRALALEPRPTKKDSKALLQATTKKVKALVNRLPEKKNILVQKASRKERGKEKQYTLIRDQPPLSHDLAELLTRESDHIFIDHDPLSIT